MLRANTDLLRAFMMYRHSFASLPKISSMVTSLLIRHPTISPRAIHRLLVRTALGC